MKTRIYATPAVKGLKHRRGGSFRDIVAPGNPSVFNYRSGGPVYSSNSRQVVGGL